VTTDQKTTHLAAASVTLSTSPLLVLLGGQAVIYLAISATNIADLFSTAGWYEGDWHSGNVGFVRSLLDHVGEPQWFAVATVCFAALFEAVAGVFFLLATIALVRSSATLLLRVRQAVTIALALWMVLAFGIELFIAYPEASWESFFLISFLAIATWWSSELLLSDRKSSTSLSPSSEVDNV